MQHNTLLSDMENDLDAPSLASSVARLIDHYLLLFDSFLYRCLSCYLLIPFLFLFSLSLFGASILGFLVPCVAAWASGGVILVLCVGFVAHRYLALYKREWYSGLVGNFGKNCPSQPILQNGELNETPHILASAYILFAERLEGRERSYLTWRFASLSSLSSWCCRNDLLVMRILLLEAALKYQLELIKRDPLNLTYHSQLANSYILLSRLFLDGHWANSALFRHYVSCAVAEFHIVAQYAPDDIWVHLQLATSYRELALAVEEIAACQAVLKLCPSDSDTLFRLGTLYFEGGENDKGLKIYEKLRSSHWKLAEQLIANYGCHTPVSGASWRPFNS